ncbi:collagen alpha-1(I) chain-like [Sus scrofa]|uniref:collagen alpha-1(I) chain-like n=1 Tax=Sus scrofa TaxID=9823 RepID=UPI000A2B3C8E|nr:collagen alpha-1(I) chain-like [Sus scrofa]
MRPAAAVDADRGAVPRRPHPRPARPPPRHPPPPKRRGGADGGRVEGPGGTGSGKDPPGRRHGRTRRRQPDSGKTRARRAGGRYRPHTVHGLGLDQKDLGPPRAAPGSGSSRVATSDLRSRLGGAEGEAGGRAGRDRWDTGADSPIGSPSLVRSLARSPTRGEQGTRQVGRGHGRRATREDRPPVQPPPAWLPHPTPPRPHPLKRGGGAGGGRQKGTQTGGGTGKHEPAGTGTGGRGGARQGKAHNDDQAERPHRPGGTHAPRRGGQAQEEEEGGRRGSNEKKNPAVAPRPPGAPLPPPLSLHAASRACAAKTPHDRRVAGSRAPNPPERHRNPAGSGARGTARPQPGGKRAAAEGHRGVPRATTGARIPGARPRARHGLGASRPPRQGEALFGGARGAEGTPGGAADRGREPAGHRRHRRRRVGGARQTGGGGGPDSTPPPTSHRLRREEAPKGTAAAKANGLGASPLVRLFPLTGGARPPKASQPPPPAPSQPTPPSHTRSVKRAGGGGRASAAAAAARAGREGPGQAAAGSEQWSGGMEDQRPGENPAQSRRREGKAHPETRRKHHGAAKAARPETETRGGVGGQGTARPPPKKPRINPRTRLSATWRGGAFPPALASRAAQVEEARERAGRADRQTRAAAACHALANKLGDADRSGVAHGDYHRKLIGQTFEWVVAATEGVRSARARTDDGPPDNSTEGTSGAGPHRGVAEGRGGKPQAPPPPPHPRHGPPPRRPGAPSSHERHGYDGRPAAASRVPTRAQRPPAQRRSRRNTQDADWPPPQPLGGPPRGGPTTATDDTDEPQPAPWKQGDTREAHHPGTPARPRRPGGDTHTR